MKSKAPLALMEQMVMLLIFAMAAALCLQAFAKSNEISRIGAARDRAAVLCQSMAEIIRSGGGDPAHALSSAAKQMDCRYGGEIIQADYNEDWNSVPDGLYRLTACEIPSDVSGLYTVCVVMEGEGEVLFSINVAWQAEVSGNG